MNMRTYTLYKKAISALFVFVLDVFDKYGVPVTIFFEVNEFQKFLEFDGELRKDLVYTPADKIR